MIRETNFSKWNHKKCLIYYLIKFCHFRVYFEGGESRDLDETTRHGILNTIKIEDLDFERRNILDYERGVKE